MGGWTAPLLWAAVVPFVRGRMVTGDVDRAGTRIDELFETMRAFAEAAADYQRLLDTVAERVTRFMGDGCTVFLGTEDGQWLRPAAIYNRDEAAMSLMQRTFSDLPVRLDGESFVARVMRTGGVVIVPAIDPELAARRYSPETPAPVAAALSGAHLQSLLCVPLQVHDSRLGVLALSRNRVGETPFSQEDETCARTLAEYAALAIANAMLLESQKRELATRRRAEEETKKFVALVQRSRDFIAMAGFDGRVLFINDAGRDLLGIPVGLDVTALPLADFHTDEGMGRAAILRAQGHWEGEGHLRHFGTQALIPTQISSFLVRTSEGEPLCYATVQRDLRETRRLEAHLRQVQKMEAVGRLAGGVAHDFNNLLSVILSYSWMLLDGLPKDSPFREDAQEIHTAGERAAALTQQLLAFSRQQVLELRIADLNEILAGMAKLTRRLLGEDIELVTTPGVGLRQIKVDPGQIEQVILNLAVNSRDAMPDGGTLSISTGNVDLDEAYAASHAGVSPGPYVLMTVSDTGVGIDEATIHRIFEPFFTTKPTGKGTGLGLATVFGVVKQSGGHITVASELGKGATFKVYLPRYDGGRPSAPAPRPAASIAPRASGTILLVEEDAQVRTLMQGILHRAGYRVLDAPGPLEAARESDQFSGDIDLLVTDVVMPKMNGRQLAEHVARKHPAARVIYVSGYSEEAVLDHGGLDEDVELLKKPVTPAGLLQRVRRVLEG